MAVTGDPDGVAALKALAGENKDYLRFLINEAKTNVDHAAPFTGPDGTHYRLVLNLATGAMTVERAS